MKNLLLLLTFLVPTILFSQTIKSTNKIYLHENMYQSNRNIIPSKPLFKRKESELHYKN